MPTFLTNPTNVSAGTTLTSSLYNTYLGNSGTLQYLYESLNNYTGSCGYSLEGNFKTAIIQATLATQSIPNNVNTTIVFDTFDFGADFWDGVEFDMETGGCYITNNAPVLLLCSFFTQFGTNSTGTRGARVSVTAANATVNREFLFTRVVNRPSATGFTSLSMTVPVIVMPNIGSGPLYNTPYFQISMVVYQNSGGALNALDTIMTLNKLPSC